MEFFWPDNEAGESAIQRDVDEKISECMRRRGFDYSPPPMVPGEPLRPSHSVGDGYGVVDQVVASRVEVSDAQTLGDSIDGLKPDESIEYSEALNGVGGSGGCQQEGSQVLAQLPRFDPFYRRIVDDYYAALQTDKELLRRTAEWSECVELRTQLLSASNSTLPLSRNNLQMAVFVDIASRFGRSVRWVTLEAAQSIDTAALAQPAEIVVDGPSRIGYLVWGRLRELDEDDVESALQREAEIRSADDACWVLADGEARIRELQAEAMEQVALLVVSES